MGSHLEGPKGGYQLNLNGKGMRSLEKEGFANEMARVQERKINESFLETYSTFWIPFV